MINLAREPWRPLFLREPVAQRGWSVVTRGVRAYLLRVAEDDGTLLKRCADPLDLAATLGVHSDEATLVKAAIIVLLEDGFLRWEGDDERPGWLGIDRLVTFGLGDGCGPAEPPPASSEAPSGESAPERRKRLARERKERFIARRGSVPGGVPASVPSVPRCVPESVPGNGPERVPGAASPPTPPSPGDKYQRKDRLEERDARASSVPPSVPASVPGNALTSVPFPLRSGTPMPAALAVFAQTGQLPQVPAKETGS